MAKKNASGVMRVIGVLKNGRNTNIGKWIGFIAMRPGARRLLMKNSDAGKVEFRKAQIRTKVEHPFRYIKRVFGYDKVRYRGLAKNTNLMMTKKYLLT